MNAYPTQSRERDEWILSRRGARHAVNARTPFAFLVEQERAESGAVVSVATIFLTNRECPWRCLMCDLWKNTLTESVPPGAIPAQIDHALGALGTQAAQIKLYNSGSFFDPRAIPPADFPAIAARVRTFERVVVESHPGFVGDACLRFRDCLNEGGGHSPAATARLEVAMGLETAHPDVLDKLNKRMTLDQFARAAGFLRTNGIALRVFVLVKPPFLDEVEALHWARCSVDFAFDCGAAVVSLIPTRAGNGALETLAAGGKFSPPRLSTLEAALDYGISLRRGRVFADLWDLEKFSDCAGCFAERRARLHEMNLTQTVPARGPCADCAPRP